MLLKNNSIEEVVVQEKNVYFKGLGGNKWFLVNVAMLSKEMLYNLLLKKGNLKVTSKQAGAYEKHIAIGICKIFKGLSIHLLILLVLLSGYVMWKMMKTLDKTQDDKKGNARPKIQASKIK